MGFFNAPYVALGGDEATGGFGIHCIFSKGVKKYTLAYFDKEYLCKLIRSILFCIKLNSNWT